MERIHTPRNPNLLLVAVTIIIALAAYVNAVPPDTIPVILGFLVLLSIAVFLLVLYVFRRKKIAVLLAMGIMIYFVLQYLGLRHPLYAILLTASMIALGYLY